MRETSASWGLAETAMPSTNCGEDIAEKGFGSPSATLQETETELLERDARKPLIMNIVR